MLPSYGVSLLNRYGLRAVTALVSGRCHSCGSLLPSAIRASREVRLGLLAPQLADFPPAS